MILGISVSRDFFHIPEKTSIPVDENPCPAHAAPDPRARPSLADRARIGKYGRKNPCAGRIQKTIAVTYLECYHIAFRREHYFHAVGIGNEDGPIPADQAESRTGQSDQGFAVPESGSPFICRGDGEPPRPFH